MSREEEETLEHFIRITTPVERLDEVLERADWAHDVEREELGDD